MIVVERGGTAWLIPFAAALLVAVVAALASYYATWRFKRADVNRENAFRAADLVDQAERMTASRERFRDAGGPRAASRLLERGLIRAEPIHDGALGDRFFAAVNFAFHMEEWDTEPKDARYWLGEATLEVWRGLVPYLSAPKLFRPLPPPPFPRVFPTSDELGAMALKEPDPHKVIDRLEAWRTKQEKRRWKGRASDSMGKPNTEAMSPETEGESDTRPDD